MPPAMRSVYTQHSSSQDLEAFNERLDLKSQGLLRTTNVQPVPPEAALMLGAEILQ